MTRNDLVFVRCTGEVDRLEFDSPCTTDRISHYKCSADKFVIQLIGDQYTVYDLSTLRPLGRGMSSYTIGLPKFTSDDYDAAVMYCLLKL